MLKNAPFKKYLERYFYLLGNNQKKYPFLLFLFVISSILDMIGIGLIAPFIQLATQPAFADKYSFIAYFKNHFNSYNNFVITTGIIIAVVFYMKSIVGYYVQKLIMSFSFNNKSSLINRLMHTYQKLDYSFHVKRNSASLIQRLLENTNIYTEMTLVSSLRFLSEMIVIFCIFFLLAYSSPIITFSMAMLLILMILIYDIFVKKHFHRFGEQLIESSEDILKWFNQAIYGFKEIRVLGAENFFYDKVNASGKIFANAASLAQALQSIPRYLAESALLTIVIGIVIVTLATGHNLNDMIPVLGMFAVASFRLIPSVNKAATSFTNLRYSRQAMKDLYDDLSLINESIDIKNADRIISIEKLDANRENKLFQELTIESLYFSYSESEKEVLNDINLKIKQGQCIGLVGKSGSGKTTLIDILLGLYLPTSGTVKADGKEIFKQPDLWRKMTAYIPQNFFLLDDTLQNNITLQSKVCMVDHEKLKRVIKDALLEDVVNLLPQGINSMIGEHGVKMSGGQRQRIALARAFYYDRELIIMDEATSSLDAETEQQIVETIAKMKGLKTLIVIAHRPSTLMPCDKIYELDQGNIKLLNSHSGISLP